MMTYETPMRYGALIPQASGRVHCRRRLQFGLGGVRPAAIGADR